MPRMNDGQRGDLGDGIGSIVPVLTEALRNKPGAKAKEERDTDEKDRGDTEQVFRVFEAIHGDERVHLPARRRLRNKRS